MRLACLAAFALSFAGCTGYSPYLPDGGRGRVVCETAALYSSVQVLGLTQDPADGATVTARNLTDDRTETGTVGAGGVFRVSSELGPGVVSVVATLNDLTSNEGQFTITFSDCTPSMSPRNLTLQLK
ncbi:MAG: hypothetical protein JNG84_05930 [Archangium sp.]|nr:hypothetical protein [Archangium sp.]